MQRYWSTSLKPYNTFGVDVMAKRLISVTSEEDLRTALQSEYAEELFILGGGSNILLTQDLDKTVLHINLKGKRVIEQTKDEVLVEASAGENWHEFVLWCIEKNYGGLENLSLIPGNVGTSPIQNIGAYGVELKDRFEFCEAIHIQTLETRNFTSKECQFAYRDSVFKKELKGQYIITKVVFRLTRNNHQLNTSYGAISKQLQDQGISNPGIKDVSDAVIAIRQSKLPDPKILGNSGSFFKNPVISLDQYERLKIEFPEIPGYPVSEKLIKVPAGWLIDKAGLKGYRQGDAGTHKKQALVLVNYGSASGQEILLLSKTIQEKILKVFGIEILPEVTIY